MGRARRAGDHDIRDRELLDVRSQLAPAERARLLDHDLRSQSSAQTLVNDLELGKVQQ